MSQGNPYGDNPYSAPPGGPGKPPGFPPPGSRPGYSPGGTQIGPMPKSWLVESILLLICCGGVFAIPAIVYAAQVSSKYNSGDYHGAVEASGNAKNWCLIALCIGLLCNTIVLGLNIIAIMAEGGF